MLNNELKAKLKEAKNLEEVKELIKDHPNFNAENLWKEIEKFQNADSKKLDLDELDAVSGGADRDWVNDGCAATCEWTSWCWSNDYCELMEVTYDNYWAKCPNGEEHLYYGKKCVKCGYFNPDR